ncbi:MAG TPA: sigma 54-interacting transcriptional regulator [Planctomycetota bacterium]|nr:sigma 54-interacting transcriptional regulator [Planctomycetota bacterium]
MAYTLVVQDGPGPERVYVLEKDATVGRDRACDVVLGAGGVSRKHCVLERTRDGGVVLRDLGSKNGTFVNGERVEKAKLREGDKLGVGEASLRVEALKAQDEPTTDATTRELSRPKDSPPEGAVTFLAESPEAKQVLRLVEKAAPTDSTVLVTGESGTGKEVVARLLHARSPRRSGAFVDVNCGALAPTLVDAELFGHEKGAFTGADKRREGKLELARGGTLFLDEIGELALDAQVKLLRVLEERRLVRVGGKEDVPVDFRLVAATHRDLEQLVKEGKFRQDLFYRLEVIRIGVPPLRQRKGDILPLARLFLGRQRQRTGRSVEGFAPEAEKRLLEHDWPGNARELRNVVERAVVLGEGPKVTADDVYIPHVADSADVPPSAAVDSAVLGPPPSLAEVERKAVERALRYAHWNKTKAAEILGIRRPTIYEKIKLYGLKPPDGTDD